MKQQKNGQSEGFFSSLIGERTPAKTSGLSYSVVALLFFAFSLVYVLFFTGRMDTQTGLYASFLVAPLTFCVMAFWYFSYMQTPIKQFAKEQICAPKYYLLALLLQVGLFSLGELNTLFLRFLERFGYEDSSIILPSVDGFGLVGVLLTVAVLPAFFEEFFFRGVFLRGMKGFSLVGQLLLCGGMFALYHQNPVQTLYQFLCGVGFTLVAVKAKSFFPTVLSHFLNNALIIFLYKFGVESYSTPVYIAILVLSSICLVGSVVWLVLDKGEQTEKEEKRGKYSEVFGCASLGLVVFGVTWISTLITGF